MDVGSALGLRVWTTTDGQRCFSMPGSPAGVGDPQCAGAGHPPFEGDRKPAPQPLHGEAAVLSLPIGWVVRDVRPKDEREGGRGSAPVWQRQHVAVVLTKSFTSGYVVELESSKGSLATCWWAGEADLWCDQDNGFDAPSDVLVEVTVDWRVDDLLFAVSYAQVQEARTKSFRCNGRRPVETPMSTGLVTAMFDLPSRGQLDVRCSLVLDGSPASLSVSMSGLSRGDDGFQTTNDETLAGCQRADISGHAPERTEVDLEASFVCGRESFTIALVGDLFVKDIDSHFEVDRASE